ncbi:MAG: hypothetical protein CMP12_19040 [Zunongwangia sp.]|uniref:Acyltransferase 3 domain-containing protein n=1 Tax=Zunongwangia profunda TaxID=398743 RepID=A0A3D5IW72_9FLAO|nr:acyltransferase [Zunongwangia profunda]MAB91638.1 hypothetical protein [Planctomycetota bacterium]MAO37966.1 hypothetical protein [Zunongwangia sp.]MAS72485.1 hypothetical protein [Zunongwangia sp.]HCV79933.1 hypothetical protein [Zunongwangia profunda]|tara:strand:- start:3985 stop:5058 length:1074 start_codon:yes stop_codon:yes gene_type:complete
MTQYVSEKLKIVSFISILMVVLLHAKNLDLQSNSSISYDIAEFIQDFFTGGITKCAVPIFFCISGFLFFMNFNFDLKTILGKWKKRFMTLFIPYFLWSLWGFFIYFLLQSLPFSRKFFTNELLSSYSIVEVVDTLLLHPIPYQLWFIRDLMMLVLFSPLIYLLVKRLKFILVIIVFILWIVKFDNINLFFFRPESLLFFTLGSYLGIFKRNWLGKHWENSKYLFFPIFWLVVILLKTILMQWPIKFDLFIYILHKLSIILGLFSVWISYDLIAKGKEIKSKSLLSLASFSFFIYAAHEPILTMIKKSLFFLFNADHQVYIVMFYFLAPILTICICVLIAKVLKQIFPKVYSVMTGSR